MNRHRLWRGLLPLGGIALFLCCPEAARAGVREGLTLCGTLLIPSLFPISVLAGCLLGLGLSEGAERLAGPWMQRLFGLPGAAALPLLLGLLGGFPLGARLAAEAYRKGTLTRAEAARLSGLSNNAGPAFLVGAVGGMLGSPAIGAALLGIQLLSLLLTGLLLRGKGPAGPRPGGEGTPPPATGPSLPDCIRQSALGMVGLTGAVVFFRALTACLARLLPLEALPPLGRAVLSGVLEVSGGLRLLADLPRGAALPAAAGLICWGGVCVHLQGAEALSAAGLPLGPYLGRKALQGVLGLLLALPLLGLPGL